MNKYPPWKYALILVALVVSLLYAAPNLFGEVPAVQVSGIRASTKVDAAMQAGLEAALKEAGIAPTLVELDEAALRFRFADPDTQLKARDVIQSKVGPAMWWRSTSCRTRRNGCRRSAPSRCTSASTCAGACISSCRWT